MKISGEEPEFYDIDDNFPGFTEYTESDCLFCKVIRVNSIKTLFLGHWQCKPLFPIIVSLLIISLTFVCNFVIDKSFTKEVEITCDVLIIFLALIYITCYFQIIIVGPGYFPFYYDAVKSKKITDFPPEGVNYNPAGIISNFDQYTYAITHDRPNRSIVSREARRIVIMPDHICKWTSSWIGKKNLKLFIQFNAYGTIYCLFYVILSIISIINYYKKGDSLTEIIVISVFASIALGFLIYQIKILITSLINMFKGQTQWELWNKKVPSLFDKGSKENIKAVCGEDYNILTCLCPTSPFKNITEEDLVKDYANYYT